MNFLRLPLLALLLGLLPAAAHAQRTVIPGGNGRAPISVDSAKLEYFDKEQKLVYSGNVVAKQGEATLKAGTLMVFLTSGAMQSGDPAGAGGNQINRMEATGGVVVISKDQVGTGDVGAYDRAKNEVVLTGNVSLSQGGNIIKGQKDSRLVYDLNTSQAVIVGGVTSLITPSGDDPTKKPAPASRPAPKAQ